MAGYRPADPFNRIIEYLGMTSGYKLSLDAGDIASWPGSGQKWLDTSTNGYDFFLGTSSAVQATDPTFTGTPGALSANEWWDFDADASFTYDSANETWMNNIHRDAAIYTVLAWVYITNVGSSGVSPAICGTLGNAGSSTVNGFQYQLVTATAVQRIQILTGTSTGTTTVLQVSSTGTAVAINGWHLCGLSINENGGATAGQFYLDGVANGAAFNPAYTAPSTGNASFTLQVGAEGNNARSLGINGAARVGFCGMWEGATLTSAQISNFYNYSAPFIAQSFDNSVPPRKTGVVGY